MPRENKPSQFKKSVKCPSCGMGVVWEENAYRPFCSEACHQRDLGNWASEKYRIAGDMGDPGAGEE